MKYLIAIWVVIVLLGLLFISLINLSEYGTSGLILAGISAFALCRVFKFIITDGTPDDTKEYHPSASCGSGARSDPLDYIFFGEISEDDDDDDWQI